jgi:hypothetical protein
MELISNITTTTLRTRDMVESSHSITPNLFRNITHSLTHNIINNITTTLSIRAMAECTRNITTVIQGTRTLVLRAVIRLQAVHVGILCHQGTCVEIIVSATA